MRRSTGARIVVGLLLAGTIAGCGGGSGGRGDDGARSPTGTSRGTGARDQGAAAYVGLKKSAAITKAEAAGTPWRITREDDETFMVTLDYDPTRLNFEIDDGTVTTATYG